VIWVIRRINGKSVEEADNGLQGEPGTSPQILPEAGSGSSPGTSTGSPADFVSIYDISDVWILDKARYIVRKHLNQVENYAQFVADKLINRGIHIDFSGHIAPNPYGFTLVITFNIAGIRRDLLKNYLRPFKQNISDRSPVRQKYKRIDKVVSNISGEEDIDISDVEVELIGGIDNSSNPAPGSQEAQGEGGEGEGSG